MTHPLIDECAVPMAVHAAEVRRVRATVLHRDRPTEDPAGAPSGLRWRYLEHGGWRLWRGEVCVGGVLRVGQEWWTGSVLRSGIWRTIATGPLVTVAREVRRG